MIFLDSIICGDNVAAMKQMPDNFINLTVTSPPYDNLRTYGGDAWDFEAVANELFRITKQGGVVVWVVADATINGSETGTSFRQALYFKEIGFNLHDTMIYQKDGSACHDPRNKRYRQEMEYMFVFSKGTPMTYNELKDRKTIHGGKTIRSMTKRRKDGSMRKTADEGRVFTVSAYSARSNVWKINADKQFNGHPAIFPEPLAKDHIVSWSNPGNVVLDPFVGSGTTCKAAKELGRHWIGIEINPEYVEIAVKRLAQGVLSFES